MAILLLFAVPYLLILVSVPMFAAVDWWLFWRDVNKNAANSHFNR